MKYLLEKGKEYSPQDVARWCFQHGMDDLARLIRKHPPKHPFVSDGASCFPEKLTGWTSTPPR